MQNHHTEQKQSSCLPNMFKTPCFCCNTAIVWCVSIKYWTIFKCPLCRLGKYIFLFLVKRWKYNTVNTTQYCAALEMLKIFVQWDKLATTGIVIYSADLLFKGTALLVLIPSEISWNSVVRAWLFFLPTRVVGSFSVPFSKVIKEILLGSWVSWNSRCSSSPFLAILWVTYIWEKVSETIN